MRGSAHGCPRLAHLIAAAFILGSLSGLADSAATNASVTLSCAGFGDILSSNSTVGTIIADGVALGRTKGPAHIDAACSFSLTKASPEAQLSLQSLVVDTDSGEQDVLGSLPSRVQRPLRLLPTRIRPQPVWAISIFSPVI